MKEAGLKSNSNCPLNEGQSAIAFLDVGDVQNEMFTSAKRSEGFHRNRPQKPFNPRFKIFSVLLPRLVLVAGVAFSIEVWGRGKHEVHCGRAEIFSSCAVNLGIGVERFGKGTVSVYGAWFNVGGDVNDTGYVSTEESPTESGARVPDTTAGKAVAFADEFCDRRFEDRRRATDQSDSAQDSVRFDRVSVSELEAYGTPQRAFIVPSITGADGGFPRRFKAIRKEAAAHANACPVAWLNDAAFVDDHAESAQLADVALNAVWRNAIGVRKRGSDQFLYNFIDDGRIGFGSLHDDSVCWQRFSRSTTLHRDDSALSAMLGDDSIYGAGRNLELAGQLVDLYALGAGVYQPTFLGFVQFHSLLPASFKFALDVRDKHFQLFERHVSFCVITSPASHGDVAKFVSHIIIDPIDRWASPFFTVARNIATIVFKLNRAASAVRRRIVQQLKQSIIEGHTESDRSSLSILKQVTNSRSRNGVVPGAFFSSRFAVFSALFLLFDFGFVPSTRASYDPSPHDGYLPLDEIIATQSSIQRCTESLHGPSRQTNGGCVFAAANTWSASRSTALRVIGPRGAQALPRRSTSASSRASSSGCMRTITGGIDRPYSVSYSKSREAKNTTKARA